AQASAAPARDRAAHRQDERKGIEPDSAEIVFQKRQGKSGVGARARQEALRQAGNAETQDRGARSRAVAEVKILVSGPESWVSGLSGALFWLGTRNSRRETLNYIHGGDVGSTGLDKASFSGMG